jgi:hypothetical protein
MKKLLPLLALLILTGAGCTSAAKNQQDITPEPVMCTMEAKQCPDGSYVGRSGPKCEFAACPGATTDAQTYKDWQTVNIGGVVSFQIPPNCHAEPGAGSTYVTCPTADNETPTPEFVFSSDGVQVNMKRWEDMESPYWKDVLASMKVIQPLNRNIQINIQK